MKKTTTAALIGGFGLLLVAVFVILMIRDPKIANIEDEKFSAKESYNKKKQAVLYISQDAEKIEDGKTQGCLIFIDQQGEIKAYEIDPVEYGNTVIKNNHLMIEQSNKIVLAKDKAVTTKFSENEYRGLRAGYLPKTKQFYSLYNSGLSEKYDYKMTVRYSNEQDEFQELIIPNFVTAVGEEKDKLLLITQDLISGEFQLKTMALKDNAKPELLAKLDLEDSDGLDIVSQIIAEKDAYYFVVSNYESDKKEDIILCKIDRQTLKMKQQAIANYRSLKETTDSLPLTYNDSLHKWGDSLYYANGRGQIYKYNLESSKVSELMKLQGFPVSNVNYAQIRFTDKYIYTIYLNSDNKVYLDKYDLKTTRRIQHEVIKGLMNYVNDEDVFTNLNLFSN